MILRDAIKATNKERDEHYQKISQFVNSHTIQQWIGSMLEAITVSYETIDVYGPTPRLGLDQIIERYNEAERRLILMDYDGTLTPIKRIPSAAVPAPELLRSLRLLTSDPRNIVYIISGRDQVTLDDWLGSIPRLGMSAEHGCFLKPISVERAEPLGWMSLIANNNDLEWRGEVIKLMEYYTERTPGSFIERKNMSVTWHYRLADPDFGSWQSKELQTHLEHSIADKFPVDVVAGKKNIEVRPKACNKGEIVRTLVQRHGIPEFILCAGDDKTDEDMFRALAEEFPDSSNWCFTCGIGASTKKTAAKYHLNSPEQIISLLLHLCTLTLERQSGVTL